MTPRRELRRVRVSVIFARRYPGVAASWDWRSARPWSRIEIPHRHGQGSWSLACKDCGPDGL